MSFFDDWRKKPQEGIDWNRVLNGQTDGFNTPVLGARVGDTLNEIPLEQATSVEPKTPGIQRSWGSRGVFNILEDGREVPVPRETLLNELRRYDGRVYIEGITYELEDHKIRKIWVRGALLKGLRIAKESEVEQKFGPSMGVQRMLGWVVYHFSQRSLSVAWDSKEGCVEHVAFGPVEWKPPVFRAKDVLVEWLSARRSRHSAKWEEPKDRSSSEWVRYARVTALLRAFELGSPEAFAEGEFLKGRTLSDYPRAEQALSKWWGRLRRDASRYPEDALSRLFWWLLIYRMEAQSVLRLNSGWLEASHPGILTALQVTNQANGRVSEALDEVEALLVEMISPIGKEVTEREMITRWGWPEVDLMQLENDEL